MSVKRWKITIQYDGSDFAGWQKQDNVPTIQESIETAIKKFCGQDINITAAGRTDAGVHSHGQVAHFDLDYGDRKINGFELAKAINAHLFPKPIVVIDAQIVNEDFHARFNAKNKLYRYRLVVRRMQPVLDRHFVWHQRHNLDVEAMRLAANHLIGHHDFTSFRDSECQAKDPHKTLDRVEIFEEPYDDFNGRHIYIELEAKSFLHHQCRNIVGTLADVGKGKIKPDDIPIILEKKDRASAGMTAPAAGLSLVKIEY